MRELQENYDLHPLAIEDALLAHQLPKLNIYGDQLFVVARPAYLTDGQIAYGETSVFVGETFIISVRHGSVRAHSGLRQQLESSPGLLRHGVDYVLHAILDFIVDGYLPIVEAIEEEVAGRFPPFRERCRACAARSRATTATINICAKVVGHARYFVFQMAEVAIPGNPFADILRLIAELRPPPFRGHHTICS